ncbi:Uncharacterised protein [uncultured archaeon]|nr:Uncharacterised protein [uncultured archaeon]
MKTGKGVTLTMDALFALALLLISVTFVLGLLSTPSPYKVFGADLAADAVDSIRTLKLSDLNGSAKYPYASYVYQNNLTSSEFNSTIAESLVELFVSGETNEALRLANETIAVAIPSGYGIDLLVENATGLDCTGASTGMACVYNRTLSGTRRFVNVGRHFVYSNNVTRELRLVLYK